MGDSPKPIVGKSELTFDNSSEGLGAALGLRASADRGEIRLDCPADLVGRDGLLAVEEPHVQRTGELRHEIGGQE
jgi:hypothetical protein